MVCLACVEGEEAKGKIIINQTASKYTPGFAWWVLYIDSNYPKYHDNATMKCMDKRLSNYSYSVREEMSLQLRPHDYVRPHTWIVVLLNCPPKESFEPDLLEDSSEPGLLDIKYTVHFINQDGTEFPSICPGMESSSSSITEISLIATLLCILLSLVSFKH